MNTRAEESSGKRVHVPEPYQFCVCFSRKGRLEILKKKNKKKSSFPQNVITLSCKNLDVFDQQSIKMVGLDIEADFHVEISSY